MRKRGYRETLASLLGLVPPCYLFAPELLLLPPPALLPLPSPALPVPEDEPLLGELGAPAELGASFDFGAPLALDSPLAPLFWAAPD